MSGAVDPGQGGQDRLAAALAAVDAANADDPATVVVDGVERPKELAHAELATAWVLRLDPAADEVQLLAARAHHLRRWATPRSRYPEGRAGYLRWRTDLKARHAAEVAEILTGCGYDQATVDRVAALVRKDGVRRGGAADPAAQTHEDALCLVFLETQLDPVAEQLGPAKAVDVLRKTMAKMSDRALAAVADLPLSPRGRALVAAAAGV